jgi:protocatechuate 3,4-dioxygenase beta subunit
MILLPAPVLILVVLFVFPQDVRAQTRAPFPPHPPDIGWVTEIAAPDEPGTRLIINGTVYESDGKTPMPGFVLYLYQTDSSGVYNRVDGSWQRPRLRGWAKTDSAGRYEIRTIRPGNYPGSSEPAHIHLVVQVSGRNPEWHDSFLFEDDRFLDNEERARIKPDGWFSPVLKLQKRTDGVQQGRRDIRIEVE